MTATGHRPVPVPSRSAKTSFPEARTTSLRSVVLSRLGWEASWPRLARQRRLSQTRHANRSAQATGPLTATPGLGTAQADAFLGGPPKQQDDSTTDQQPRTRLRTCAVGHRHCCAGSCRREVGKVRV